MKASNSGHLRQGVTLRVTVLRTGGQVAGRSMSKRPVSAWHVSCNRWGIMSNATTATVKTKYGSFEVELIVRERLVIINETECGKSAELFCNDGFELEPMGDDAAFLSETDLQGIEGALMCAANAAGVWELPLYPEEWNE